MKKKVLISMIMLVVLATASQAALITWNGVDTVWATASNWDLGVPTSGVDSIHFASTQRPNLFTEFTLASGQTWTIGGGNTIKIGDGGHLTIATGSTFDMSGTGILAQSGNTNQKITFEAGATAKTKRFFASSGFTSKWIANAAGVTTFDISDRFQMDGALDVDLTDYDLANGDTLVLAAYGQWKGNGFSSVNVTGIGGASWTEGVDYTVAILGDYDTPGEDLSLSVTIVPEPATLLIFGLGTLILRRKK